MKTKLNIICGLIFVVIIASCMGAVFDFNIGRNEANHDMGVQVDNPEQQVLDADLVELIPLGDKRTAVKVKNATTGKEINAWPTKMYVETDSYEPKSTGAYLLETFAAVIGLIGFVGGMFTFIWFIIRVNGSHIFDRKNIVLLRITGTGLLVYGVISMVWSILTRIHTVAAFSLDGYANNWLGGIEYAPILLGLIAFVAAQVFAMAHQMKEDQELTI